jgi:hypothetical protein
MTADMLDLSRRAVACKGWKWMLGMQAITLDGLFGHRVTEYTVFIDPDNLPDLTDPATLGCMLALVREAWSDPYLCAVGDSDTGWRVDAVTAQVQDLHGYSSEAEALVYALERSP